MLINLSNHPSDKWGNKQTAVALLQYGHTEDIAFPAVSPDAHTNEVIALAQEYANRCKALFADFDRYNPEHNHPHEVHVQGEFTLTYHLVKQLKESGIVCVASTSERQTIDLGNGKKELQFSFVQFREY